MFLQDSSPMEVVAKAVIVLTVLTALVLCWAVVVTADEPGRRADVGPAEMIDVAEAPQTGWMEPVHPGCDGPHA